MRYKLALAAACLAVSTLAVPAVSSAAAVAPAQSTAMSTKASLVEAAQWRPWGRGWGRCRAWRRECAARWGWGGPRFRRCMWRHGC